MTSVFRFNEREIFDFSTSLRGNNKDGSGHDFFLEKNYPRIYFKYNSWISNAVITLKLNIVIDMVLVFQ